MAMSDGAKEAIWWKALMEDLGVNPESFKMYFDNQGAGALSLNEGIQRRTKGCISSVKRNIAYTPTADMLADIFTKPLGRVEHTEVVKMIGLC